MTTINLHIFLQVEEGDGVSVSSEGILTNVGDVVRTKVQVSETVQGTKGFRRYLMQTIVSQTKVLQVLYKKYHKVTIKKAKKINKL